MSQRTVHDRGFGRAAGVLMLIVSGAVAGVVATRLVIYWPGASTGSVPGIADGTAIPADAGAPLADAEFAGSAEQPASGSAGAADADLVEDESATVAPPGPELAAETAEIAMRLLGVSGSRQRGFALLVASDDDAALDVLRSLYDRAAGNERAERGIAAGIRMLLNADSPRVDAELYRYFESGSDVIQRAAARLLEQRGDPRPMADWVASLQYDLRSADATNRVRALAQLGRTESQQAVSEIVPLLQDPELRVRISAALAVSRTGGAAEIPMLQNLLEDEAPIVRRVADRALLRLQGRAALLDATQGAPPR